MASLRAKQKFSLQSMINLNNGITEGSQIGAETIFSVLIYDRHAQDIISPLLSVKDLREMGVTLHLLLHTEREEVPDVPAIYFCLPTTENLQKINQDFNSGLYSSYYLNFCTPISRQKMEDLAQAALTSRSHTLVKKIYDQYINFICLEDDLFCLRYHNNEALSFYGLNRSDAKDSDIESTINAIVDSLFSVFVNLGQVPIIRSEKGNAAEMVAERLDKKLRENLRDTRNSFFTSLGSESFMSGKLSFHRPLLMLVDRSIDLATPLHHTWTYQALVHDLLGLSLNRVSVPEGDTSPESKPKYKDYELNIDDQFWSIHKASPFPNVAEAVETELEDYKMSEARVKDLKTDLPNDGNFLSDNATKLTSAITSLPELLKRKSNIDKHASIAMGLLEAIKSRKVDVYFELEEKIMSQSALEKSLLEVIMDPGCGSASDKLRLFLIYYLCSNDISNEEVERYVAALMEVGADIAPVAYMKRWKSLLKMTKSSAPSEYTGGVAKTVSMFSKLMNHGSNLFVEGVKNFVLKENKLPITRIVDNLMELKSCQEDKEFLYFDPKIIRPSDATPSSNRSKSPFHEAVVFVVGGGNYVEYTNLCSYAKKKSGASEKRIIYGSTDIISPEQFLQQLSSLGDGYKP